MRTSFLSERSVGTPGLRPGSRSSIAGGAEFQPVWGSPRTKSGGIEDMRRRSHTGLGAAPQFRQARPADSQAQPYAWRTFGEAGSSVGTGPGAAGDGAGGASAVPRAHAPP